MLMIDKVRASNQSGSFKGEIMKVVEFKFDMDQKVETPFGDIGIVTMLGFDEAGNRYFIQTAKQSVWFKEDQLKLD